MRKILLLLFALIAFTHIASGQNPEQKVEDYVIKMKIEDAKLYFMNSFFDFHIDSIIDNRLDKTPYVGIVKRGILGAKWSRAKFEGKSINQDLQALFNSFSIEKEKTEAIIAKINYFEIGEFQSNPYLEEGIVYLDIDFFKKKNNEIIAHYHGKFKEALSSDVTSSHAGRIYRIFKTAFDQINLSNPNKIISKQNYNDSTYVPKEGFYRSYLDYIYNTPIVTQKKYKISYEDETHTSIFIKSKGDSLNFNIFGYSDGNFFYSFSNNSWYMKTRARGHYLFLEDAIIDMTSGEYLGQLIAIGLGGVSGTTKGNVVINLETGRMIRADSDAFIQLLKEENVEISERFLSSKMKKKNAIYAIKALNRIYHEKTIQK